MAIFRNFLGIEEYTKMTEEEKKKEYLRLAVQYKRICEMERNDPEVSAAKTAYENLREPYKNRQKAVKQRMSVLLTICDIDETLRQESNE